MKSFGNRKVKNLRLLVGLNILLVESNNFIIQKKIY